MQPIAGMIMFDFCSKIWGDVSQGATQTASELTVQTLINLLQLHVWRVAVCISSSDSPVAVHLDVFFQFVLFMSFLISHLCVCSRWHSFSPHSGVPMSRCLHVRSPWSSKICFAFSLNTGVCVFSFPRLWGQSWRQSVPTGGSDFLLKVLIWAGFKV